MSYEEILKENGNKRWDICLMNPPYSGSTHLKFLEKVIEISNKVISIQPTRWLDDIISKKNKSSAFNKYEESISKHIKDIDYIDTKTSTDLFSNENGADIELQMILGIYTCDENGGYNYNKTNNIFEKIINKMKSSWEDNIKTEEPTTGVVISKLVGGKNGLTERSLGIFDWHDDGRFIYIDGKRLDNGLSFYENRLKTAWGNVKPKKETWFINFKNENECHNFINYSKLYLIRYLIRIETVDTRLFPKYLPFMDDYSKEWTDEMLYKYFNITKEEQKEIENLVNKYIKYNKEVDSKWRG